MAFTRTWDETVPTNIEHAGQGARRIRELKEDTIERFNAFRHVGSISSWPGDVVPDGWLECDGSAISRTTYADLFAIIGTRWGNGDGSLTFNIPDYRGLFFRGQNNGRTGDWCDPDILLRYIKKTGTLVSGSAVVSGIDGTSGLTSGDTIKSFSFIASMISGSDVLTDVYPIKNLYLDLPVSGAGIPSGSKISAINSSTSVSIDSPATSSGKNISLVGDPVGSASQISSVDSESQITLDVASALSGLVDLFFNVGDKIGSIQEENDSPHRHGDQKGVYSSGYVSRTAAGGSVNRDRGAYFSVTGLNSGNEFRPSNKNSKKIIKASELS